MVKNIKIIFIGLFLAISSVKANPTEDLNQTKSALQLIAKAQALVIAYDESSPESQSIFFLQLQEVRPQLEVAESLLESFLEKNKPELLVVIKEFNSQSAIHSLGFAHFLRRMSYDDGCVDCSVPQSVMDDYGLTFNPYSDLEIYEYRKSISLKEVAASRLLSAFKNLNLKDSEAPTATYDWKNRNWIVGNLNEGEFVVTYDDGPLISLTEKIANQWIASGQAKPAFFWLSQNVLKHKSLVKDLYKKGFPVACHSERHADLGNLAKAKAKSNLSSLNKNLFKQELEQISDSEFAGWKARTLNREIVESSNTIESILKEVDERARIRHYRLPYGSGVRNDLIGNLFESRNLDHFFWKIDSLDWQDSSPNTIYDRVYKQMSQSKKGIILFHDIQPPTEKVTEKLIQLFSSRKWSAVSIHQQVPN
ncbi:MAG: polysaccharide deacetylase family protein [Oligoflexia bacterium]|nr:polysaccharide deacetylase family protein [Oligoflexia bacterium]